MNDDGRGSSPVMHPFGGAQKCPRCSKVVYAAEQVMGPGRKLYHKPCLACTNCSKRLDSYTLLEHDEKPYCKSCHIKNFGTRDLRQANLPHPEPRPASPVLATPPRVSSPLDNVAPRSNTAELIPTSVGTPSNSGRPGLGGLPRTIPLTPTRSGAHGGENSLGTIHSATGTRYGAALTNTESPKRWGGSTNPCCPRCGKSVYFAEQVKAVGKTYHKNCLRCTECNTSLDSNRLRDHDGEPICVRCYGKVRPSALKRRVDWNDCQFHGPQGGGYALLGKSGG